MSAPTEQLDQDISPFEPILKELCTNNLSALSAAETFAKEALEPDISLEGHPWRDVFKAAYEYPDQHDRLVDMLLCLRKLSPTPCKKSRGLRWQLDYWAGAKSDGMMHWEDLPCLGIDLNSEWNNLELPPKNDPRRDETIRWFVSVNIFTARMTIADDDLLQEFDMFGLWTMRGALEDVESSLDERDAMIPAAEAWISVAGPQMYHWDREFEYGPTIGDAGGGGPLWNGKHGFCQQRWGLWRRRFAVLSKQEDLSEHLRGLARKAEQRMGEIETEAGE